ncbi:MAG: AAA family ATPase [Thermomicrobiales bacterium]
MAVITLARQVGSGGSSIASALADRLEYRIFDRHALRQEAQRIGLELPSTFEEFAREERAIAVGATETPGLYVSYGELEFDQAILGRGDDASRVVAPSFLDALTTRRREILLALHAVVFRLAALDRMIFVGAGTQILLADTPGVLRAKIMAAEAVRAGRLSSTYGLPPEHALRAVRRADYEQRDYNKAIYGADWDDPLLWDVVVNTDHVTVEDASEWLAGLVGRTPYDERLADAVSSVLRAAGDINLQLAHQDALRSATIFAAPNADGVVLYGEAKTRAARDEAIRLAETAAGAVPVRDEVFVFGEDGLLGEW